MIEDVLLQLIRKLAQTIAEEDPERVKRMKAMLLKEIEKL